MESIPRLLIKGVIPITTKPSVSLLTLRLNVTNLFSSSGDDYLRWKHELEDLLNEMNLAMADRPHMVRGRKVQARYKTVNEEGRKLRIREVIITPYPASILSELYLIRMRYYNLLSRIAGQPLYQEEFMSLYIIPEARIGQFREEIAELNARIAELQKRINEVEQSPRFKSVIAFLAKTVPAERWSKRYIEENGEYAYHTELHPIFVKFVPVALSRDFINTFVSEEVKAEITNSIREMASRAVQAEMGRIENIIQRLATYKMVNRGDLRNLLQTISETEEALSNYGLLDVVAPWLQPLKELVSALLNNDDAMAMQALERLNVQYGATVVQTLQNVHNQLQQTKDIRNARIEAVLNRVFV